MSKPDTITLHRSTYDGMQATIRRLSGQVEDYKEKERLNSTPTSVVQDIRGDGPVGRAYPDNFED